MDSKQYLETITSFINHIGISCVQGIVKDSSFLPGIDIVAGGIVYDAEKMQSPGDLLHEAGHIAVLLPKDRVSVTSPNVNGDLQPGGAEIAAIAWSWAAANYLQVPPEVVFHPDGYHGESNAIIDNFSNRRYFGVSLLQWFGMTNEKHVANISGDIYPTMQNWLRR